MTHATPPGHGLVVQVTPLSVWGGAALGQGRSIPLRLAPAQVVFTRVSRPPDGRPGVPSLR